MPRSNEEAYMAFPFRVSADGVATSGRVQHARAQIEQVLYTNPGERVFRPEFGAGVHALVFEPNTALLAEVTRKRLMASLSEALQGEVDPRTLRIDVRPNLDDGGETLIVVISYTLATIGQTQRHELLIGSKGGQRG